MISKVSLTNFRNFLSKNFIFSDKITIVVGHNASGKTNILESIYLMSVGKSFKAKVEQEMINYSKDIARVNAKLTDDTILEAVITKGFIDVGGEISEKVVKKKLMVNGVSRRMVDFAANFKTVLFGPWDMDLITESPSVRRRFLDTVLSQINIEYRRSLLSYEKGLRQRNRLLFRIREEGISRSQLAFWDHLLIKNGQFITSERQNFIDYANSQPSLNGKKLKIKYDNSIISVERLDRYKSEEVASATTLVGPHRDDLIFFDDERNLQSFGSRGEQRMGVLWLKMCELNFIEEKSGERPTLLLDDIFSELDHEHRDKVMDLSTKQQTIITTADEHFIEDGQDVEKINLG